jgi:hypothetical protein
MLRIMSVARLERSIIVLTVFYLALLAICVACYGAFEKSTAQAGTDDFYAYYTRLDYDIPVDSVLGYIPRIDEEDEDEEEEDWASWDRWDGGGPITGKYADIIVNI